MFSAVHFWIHSSPFRLSFASENNGYTAEEADAQKLMSDFINGGLVNTGKYSDDDKMLRYSLADYKNS